MAFFGVDKGPAVSLRGGTHIFTFGDPYLISCRCLMLHELCMSYQSMSVLDKESTGKYLQNTISLIVILSG